MVREVGSPTNTHVRDSDRRGESPSVRSDGSGHIGPHVAGKGWTTERLRPDDGDFIFRRPGAKWPPTQG
jgi:hypothetical protein